MVDLLEYLRGDGRLYEIVNNRSGAEVVQTQTEPKNVFYHVKNSQWEELWADDVYIYRGTDTSPGGGEVYTLSEDNHYGSAWMPRFTEVGEIFRRSPTVTWRIKANGLPVPSKPPAVHVTYIKVAKLHDQLKFTTSLTLPDVAEVHSFIDEGGKPASSPWEKYFYAKGYGLVAFEDMFGGFRSWIAQTFTPAIMPPRVREVLPWLSSIQQRFYLPTLPSLSEVGLYSLSKLPGTWINVRDYPLVAGRDVGDLRRADVVTLYAPQVDGWVYVQNADVHGWVSLQEGRVEFTQVPNTEPPDDEEPIPPDDTEPPVVIQWPGSKEEAIKMRDAYKALEQQAREIWMELDALIARMN